MEEYQKKCNKIATLFIKQSFFDKIIGRTVEEKINNYCHLEAIKFFKIKNFKRNGRWAFKIIFGFSELFSSIFSLLSLLCCIYYYNILVSNDIKKSPLKKVLTLQYYFFNVAFVSSFFFHMRDTMLTKYTDYLTAFLSLSLGMISSLSRLIYSENPKIINSFINSSIVFIFVLFILHSYKMVFYRWDYVYNKILCGIIFTLSCFFDLVLYYKYSYRSYSKYIIKYITGMLLAGGIEICDISPFFFIFDSHAFWHLLMSISGIFYFKYLKGYLVYHKDKHLKVI